MRRTIILMASLSIIVLGLWGSAVILLDEERLKSMVSEEVARQIGRKVEIRGALRIRLFPRLHIQADRVVISGPEEIDGAEFLEADTVSMSVRMLPLIRGSVSADQLGVSGATINLVTDSGNRDGESEATAWRLAPGGEVLSTRQLRLEDVRLLISDLATEQVEQVHIDLVEIDHFAFDRHLDFRFRGNLGEPPIFEQMQIRGLLHIPSDRGPLRMADMHVAGTLRDSGSPLSLTGELVLGAASPLRFVLNNASLEVADQTLHIGMVYEGGERARTQMSVSGSRVQWHSLASAMALDADRLLPFARGIDADIELGFQRVALDQFALEGLSGTLSSREGVVVISDLEALMPGAMIHASGSIDSRYQPPRSQIAMRLEMDDFGHWLEAMSFPAVLNGTGAAEFDVQAIGLPGEWNEVEALGDLELWDGRWVVSLDVEDGEAAEDLEFSHLGAQFRLVPGLLDIPSLSLVTNALEVRGWSAIDLDQRYASGRFRVVEGGREVELSGNLDAMRVSAPLGEPLVRRPGNLQ